ncbi:MAG: hypothetical protein H6703_02105 [Myxococcales bacterium]|nr:hypothetical protein [Myxococcales bacterium]MCB9541227.1 hypothetical protein [Myxococcales bacterium]
MRRAGFVLALLTAGGAAAQPGVVPEASGAAADPAAVPGAGEAAGAGETTDEARAADETPATDAAAGADEAPAAEDDGWGAADDGWGDGADAVGFGDVPVTAIEPPPPPRAASFTGFVRHDLGLWVERLDGADQPFAKNRLSLDLALRWRHEAWRIVAELHGEYDAAYLADRDRFDAPTLDTYEARVLSGEQYVAVALDAFELTIGRQIVAWGEGEMLSPLDVTSPRDLREPGLADLDDLRLGVLASRVGWFTGGHRVELMAVHEAYFGERPPPLGEFSPLRAFVTGNALAGRFLSGKTIAYREAQDRFDPAETQGFLRWVYKGPGLDAGLYAASALDQQGVVRLPPVQALLDDPIRLALDHERYWLFGHSGATTIDAWIIRWELAQSIGRAFNTGDPDAEVDLAAVLGGEPLIGVAEASLLTGMVGVAWSGIADTTIAVEAQAGLFFDRPDDLLFPADAPTFALRFTRLALRQKLQLSAVATVFGLTAEHGWLLRAEAEHAFADGFSAGVGYVHYGTGRDGEFGPFYGLDEHDRVFARLRWDFTLY